MFEVEYSEYEDNKKTLEKSISEDLNIDKKDVLVLALDYLVTEKGYTGLYQDIKKKVK